MIQAMKMRVAALFVFAAFVCASNAWAASYKIGFQLKAGYCANGDNDMTVTPNKLNTYYDIYVLSAAQLEAVTGLQSPSAADVSAWLRYNFEPRLEAVKGQAEALTVNAGWSDSIQGSDGGRFLVAKGANTYGSQSACGTAAFWTLIVYKNGNVSNLSIWEGASDGSTLRLSTDGKYYVLKSSNASSRVSFRDTEPDDGTTYPVTLNKNGGMCEDLTSYTWKVGATLPTEVTKPCYTFDGWYTNETFAGEAVTAIGSTEKGEREFWAKFTENKTEEIVTDDSGVSVPVRMSDKWMADNDVTDVNEEGANGLPAWKSYVLGLDPNDETSSTVLVPVQSSDSTEVTLQLGNGFAPRMDAGVTITYQLGTKAGTEDEFSYGAEQVSSEFSAPLPASGVQYYSIRAKLNGATK